MWGSNEPLNDRIKLAESLGWKVWAYDAPAKAQIDDDSRLAPRKRVYILRSPLNVPFNDGKPVTAQAAAKPGASPDAVASASFKVRYHDHESDAWGDLPQTEDEIRAYSEWRGE